MIGRKSARPREGLGWSASRGCQVCVGCGYKNLLQTSTLVRGDETRLILDTALVIDHSPHSKKGLGKLASQCIQSM